ncbi:MAG TPA: hypothetical protein ENM97_04245 [Moorella mulderi]|nr:hypothetical protein [Moorella mulderi]
MEYGSESDPRAYRFDGELNIANRGLMEFQEMLKCDERFLYHLLSLSQEGNFKVGRFALISADEVVIAHTNPAEYREFISNPRNEALRSRIMVIPVPYNLRVDEEVKIYEKLIRESEMEVHLAPFALKAAAIFSVLSRLKESKKKPLDLRQKMKLYNGEGNRRVHPGGSPGAAKRIPRGGYGRGRSPFCSEPPFQSPGFIPPALPYPPGGAQGPQRGHRRRAGVERGDQRALSEFCVLG